MSSESEQSDREWLISQFYEMRNSLDAADERIKITFSVGLAIQRRLFLDRFESPANFSLVSKEQQMDYYMHLVGLLQYHNQNNDGERAAPLLAIIPYVAAIIEKDGDFEMEVAKFCDHYARKGWKIANAI
ncbi:MAG: hypothetical protein ACLPPF_20715 [Rhodomicrobium sp.]